VVDFRLYAISDRRLCDPVDFVRRAEPAGLRAFQLREKEMSARDALSISKDIRNISPSFKVFVNERADIALTAHADGVHLPESSWPAKRLKLSFPRMLCGASAHSLEAAQLAEEDGADFIVFGPVFQTPSKQALGIEPCGVMALKEVANAIRIPLFAIGGITPGRARQCVDAGAWGVAVIRDLLLAADVPQKLGEYEEALGSL